MRCGDHLVVGVRGEETYPKLLERSAHRPSVSNDAVVEMAILPREMCGIAFRWWVRVVPTCGCALPSTLDGFRHPSRPEDFDLAGRYAPGQFPVIENANPGGVVPRYPAGSQPSIKPEPALRSHHPTIHT